MAASDFRTWPELGKGGGGVDLPVTSAVINLWLNQYCQATEAAGNHFAVGPSSHCP